MALEEIFVTGATGFMKKLVHVAAKKIGKAGAVDKDLQKLKDTLEMIAAVTSDAEKKQVKDKVVRLWLRRLQDVAYDVDDLLDEISYEAMCQSQKYGNKVTILSTIKLSLKMAKRITNINQELDEITKHNVMFQLVRSVDDQNVESLDRVTHSFIGESKIVGREKDTSRIVEMLMMRNPSSSSSSDSFTPHEKISVISIVGMGGLGKTTLAQLVYKDNSIERSFEPRAWVCISDNFDIFLILKNIIESFTETKCDVSSVDLLVRKFHETIRGKKYLLVLDDLWNENAEDWEKLKGFLSGGAQGSKILVTTRKENVASIVRGTIPPYNLTTLSNRECWFIIKNRAFSPGGAVETLAMSNIGEEISRKCAGLPLAAVFIGNLMRMKQKESDWLAIRDNDVFNTPENPNKIILILKLSYDNLSSPLKKCFSYCSLFPKDYEFNRETLIRLWTAEGFLHPSTGRNQSSLEDIGNYYILSLLSSSFFQDVERGDLDDTIISFKMHDLVHDLALSVVGSHEVMILTACEMENDVSQIRRLQLIKEEGESSAFSNVLTNANKLRTVFFQEAGFFYPSSFSNKRLRVIHRLGADNLKTISSPLKFKHMRYLDLVYSDLKDVHAESIHQLYNLQTLNLHRSINVQNILQGIGSLINLQYLDLSCSDATVVPDSITRLTNLKTLDFSDCMGISFLPTDIGSFQNLSSLYISYSGIVELPDSISLISNLRHLNISGSKVKVLPDSITRLTNLQTLSISDTDITELPTNIGSLHNLLSLAFSGTRISDLPDSICRIHKLKKLGGFSGTSLEALPHNIGALTELRSLDLFDSEITELPESLSINVCKLETVELGSVCKFPKDVKNWVELRELIYLGNTDGVIMSRGIEKLTRLEVLIPYLVRKEEKEEVISTGNSINDSTSSSSIHELAHLNSLQVLRIGNLDYVRGGKTEAERAKLEDKQNIHELELRWNFKEEDKNYEEGDQLVVAASDVLEGLQPHPNLQELSIIGFPGLKLPKWMGSSSCLPNLVKLIFKNCNSCSNLLGLGQLPCLRYLEIEGMASVICLGKTEFYYPQEEEEGNVGGLFPTTTTTTLFPSLTYLVISEMQNLKEWIVPSTPHNFFPCLEELRFTSCYTLESIPDLRLWSSSLRRIKIFSCSKLMDSIPYGLKKSLTFLEYLSIDCYHNMVTEK
ncbi:putative disease resistance protein RGA1 [Papaver somniferum]|uniref:putative disease resistance protein RGA1 n=1 Tax=Papaver somniferum TaxID=3469 RepID=UPI000E6FA7D6|nr:putative disease resistance protein RGA1 [Papaver somniferum]XP_026417437.1 putative disease resistance protein RGA1 [Papaver somniferum]